MAERRFFSLREKHRMAGDAKESGDPNNGGAGKWGRPESLFGECPSTPHSIDALPAEIRAAVLEVNDFTQSAECMAASSALRALSVAAHGRVLGRSPLH